MKRIPEIETNTNPAVLRVESYPSDGVWKANLWLGERLVCKEWTGATEDDVRRNVISHGLFLLSCKILQKECPIPATIGML